MPSGIDQSMAMKPHGIATGSSW